MTRMHPSGIFLTSDDGKKIIGIKNPDNTEQLLFDSMIGRYPFKGSYYKKQPGQTVIDVSAVLAAGFSMAGATNIKSDNSSITWFGGGSCVDTTNQGGSGATLNCTRTLSSPLAALGSAPSFILPVWIEDYTKINTIKVRFSMGDTTFTNHFEFLYSVGPGAATWSKRNGWHLLSCGTGDWTSSGSPDWATQTVNAIRILFLNASGQNNARIVFDDLILNQKAKAKALLMCDGTYASQYSFVWPTLKALGMRATFSATPGDPGSAGRMTIAQIKELLGYGNAVVPRNSTTMNTQTTVDACVADVSAAQNYLKTNFGTDGEIGSRFLTYAQGKYFISGASDGDMSVPNALASQLGIIGGRTTDSTNSAGYMSLGFDNYPSNIMTAPIIGSWSGNTLATLKANVDTAIDRGQAFVYFVHDPTYGSFDDPNTVRQLYEYIALKKSQGLIDDVTWPEFYDGMTA